MFRDEEMTKCTKCEATLNFFIAQTAIFWPLPGNHLLLLLCLSLMAGLLQALKCADCNYIKSAGVCEHGEAIYGYKGLPVPGDSH